MNFSVATWFVLHQHFRVTKVVGRVVRKFEKVSKADLKRAADVARSENVTVEIEIDGRVFRISPIVSGGPSHGPVASSRGVVL